MPTVSAAKIDKLTEPGTYRAGPGLYLQLKRNGAKSWILRYQLDGRAREMGLGPLRLISITEARRRAIVAQRQLLDGVDPIDARLTDRQGKRKSGRAPSFEEAAKEFIAAHEVGWKNPKHARQWPATLRDYAYPTIGRKRVDEIDVDDVVACLQPIWFEKAETARRVRGRIESVLDWAQAKGFREGDNPARWTGVLSYLLPSNRQPPQHHKALDYKVMPDFMARLRAVPGNGARALEWLVLSAMRTTAVVGARWGEVDLDEGLWVVPAERMKGKRGRVREHRVPLSGAMVELLKNLPRDGEVLFPGRDGDRPISTATMSKVLRDMGVGVTVHGFRSTFTDWAAEETDYPREIRELALAHSIGSRVERAYRRGDLLSKRAALMEDWSTFIAGS